MGSVPQQLGNAAKWAEEADQCLEMRIGGLTYRQIATIMTDRGHRMSQETARSRINWAVDRILTPNVEQLRKIEGERLDVAQRALLPAVARGDVNAINGWIRLSESRRRLHGLDSPVVVSATVTEQSPVDAEVEGLLRQMRAAQADIEDDAVPQ